MIKSIKNEIFVQNLVQNFLEDYGNVDSDLEYSADADRGNG